MGKPIGPGPAAYLLPAVLGFKEHDPSRLRNPQYSFGVRTFLKSGVKIPGPEYSLEKNNQYGPPFNPAWTFGIRSDMPNRNIIPGPGAHHPEDCPVMKTTRPPVYSFGRKTGMRTRFQTPAPNAYGLGSAMGGNKYSMAKRYSLTAPAKSPGPAAYALEFPLTNQHHYSMGGRHSVNSKDKRPSPAEYGPDLYNPGDASFKFSFGTRHNVWTQPMIVAGDNIECKENFAKH